MTEVLRSKVYYVRAGAMVVVPNCEDLPTEGPVTLLIRCVFVISPLSLGLHLPVPSFVTQRKSPSSPIL